MLEVRAKFLEPVINREASEFIKDNYNEIARNVLKFKVPEDKALDLLNDVYISIVNAENQGNGYDYNKSTEGGIITVEEFIYGRIKGYAKNDRYRTDIAEKKKSSKDYMEVISSSSSSSDFDTLDSFQKAYAMASVYDDIEAIEDELSILERIDFCRQFDDIVGFNMLEVFKNIEALSDSNIHESLFRQLRSALKQHDEFAEDFTSLVEFSMKSPSKFKEIISRIK